MRTSIYLTQDSRGEWLTGEDDPRIDVSHDEPLTDEAVEAFRQLGRLVVKKMDEPTYTA